MPIIESSELSQIARAAKNLFPGITGATRLQKVADNQTQVRWVDIDDDLNEKETDVVDLIYFFTRSQLYNIGFSKVNDCIVFSVITSWDLTQKAKGL